jgi:hypothetical protein
MKKENELIAENLILARIALRRSKARIMETVRDESKVLGVYFKDISNCFATNENVQTMLGNLIEKWYTDVNNDITNILMEL